MLALSLGLSAACHEAPPGAQPNPLGDPSPDSVELVLYLIGDAGDALPGASPVLSALDRDVEAWSERLARDSAVAVLFLGDNVYPDGVRDPRDSHRSQDSLRLSAQLDVLRRPAALRHRAMGYFVAGNHDWGNMPGPKGVARLQNEARFIQRARAEGLAVDLLPEAGQPGPSVIDLGARIRLIFLDTHWWLQEPSADRKDAAFSGVEEALRTAGDRRVIIASHHPFTSGGTHGGALSIWEGLGVVWLLRQTGSLVQDLNSRVYRDFVAGLREVFARAGRPLIWAAGHDHSLQVLQEVAQDDPVWTLVSGAGSKTSAVAMAPGMLFGRGSPGFMRISVLRDGSIYLHVLATSGGPGVCTRARGQGVFATCMQERVRDFHTVFARRLD